MWYVLHWHLLALGWSLVSVYIWRILGELLSINVPWSQEFCDVLVLELSLLPLTFGPSLTVSSRLLHLYSTDDKTSKLMVKQFSTVRDTHRGSQSYTEKRRQRREIEVTRRRGGVKRGENSLTVNQFPKCLHSLEQPERGGEEGSQKGKEKSSQ